MFEKICLVAAAAILTLSAVGAVEPTKKHIPGGNTPYTYRYAATPEASMGARSRTGNWAAASTAGGETLEAQLDEKMAYWEDLYREKGERFVVEEGIDLAQIADMDSVTYLFENSQVYRTLVTVEDRLYVHSGGTFSRLADEGTQTLCDRYVFYLERPATLKLDASYALTEGEMGFCLVSPRGELIFEEAVSTGFSGVPAFELEAGLHSLVLVGKLEGGHMRGEIAIGGTFES